MADRKIFTRITLIIAFVLLVALIPVSTADAAAVRAPFGVLANAVNRTVVVSWEPVNKATRYIVYESKDGDTFKKIKETRNEKAVFKYKTRGSTYGYYVKSCIKTSEGTACSKNSQKSFTTVAKTGKSTIKNFLRTGLAPVGHTMYVWGGGWNIQDRAAGYTALRTGTYYKWRSFARKQNKNYNFRKHIYELKNGLDCTGFVGWCTYNVNQVKNNVGKGYVFHSSAVIEAYAKKGFGKRISKKKLKKHVTGDVMSRNGHAWISLGECSEDKSTVVLHSSPKGVRLAGTPAKDGTKNSAAAKLARKYMKKYYPKWYAKYPGVYTIKDYNTDFDALRWDSSMLSDPDGYRKMTPKQVLEDLFSER